MDYFFGEYGGGAELVYRAIQSISRAWSMRGAQTQLSTLFVEHVGAKDVEDFLAGIARDRYRYSADNAPLIFQAAQSGDEVAKNIIIWLAQGLSDLACGIIRQLNMENQTFDVVLSGSIYKGSPLILETMQHIVCELAPQARFVHLKAPPVTGAVMLAMEQVELDYQAIRERIIETGAVLLSKQQNGND
ncbi:MAG: hypothetical protein Q9P01_14825 [Anaerolineae bacterium]|nr:hypothetical protein [Anaerolineae bacterium]